MGTFFTCGATKTDIVNELLEPLKASGNLVVAKLTAEDEDSVLWTVEKGDRNGQPYQFIGCYILRQANGDWGYKPIDETMGPCFYSVPLWWLTAYPCILPVEILSHSDKWRTKVLRKKGYYSSFFANAEIVRKAGNGLMDKL